MLSIVIGVGLVPASPISVAPSIADPADIQPMVVMVDMPEALQDMAGWAVDLFDQASLELPVIRFVHHAGATKPCADRPGRHRFIDGVSVIDICATEPNKATRVMILHETAHAWAAHDLSPERKQEFQELRGWTYWRNHDAAPWHENGTEQAAEIMVWGLIDEPLGIVRIYDATCADLDAGYRALTGSAPLHGFRDLC